MNGGLATVGAPRMHNKIVYVELGICIMVENMCMEITTRYGVVRGVVPDFCNVYLG